MHPTGFIPRPQCIPVNKGLGTIQHFAWSIDVDAQEVGCYYSAVFTCRQSTHGRHSLKLRTQRGVQKSGLWGYLLCYKQLHATTLFLTAFLDIIKFKLCNFFLTMSSWPRPLKVGQHVVLSPDPFVWVCTPGLGTRPAHYITSVPREVVTSLSDI